MQLSETDKTILECLYADCRVSMRELASFLGMKHPSVHARIKKLEENGFIRQYDSLPSIQSWPFFHKIYYCSLTKDMEAEVLKLPQCVGMQYMFSFHTHQLFMFYRTEAECLEIEKMLPPNRVDHHFTASYRLDGSLFGKRGLRSKFAIPKKYSFDLIDVRLLNRLIHGGVRTPLVQLARELDTTVAVLKHRKKKMYDNGIFLRFIPQSGVLFSSVTI